MKTFGPAPIGPAGNPIPLSAAIETNGLVFLSGQIAMVDGTVPGGIAEQTDRIFTSMADVLAEAGLTLDNVAKVTVWLCDPADFAAFNAVYLKRLKPPYPARSCVISQLVLANARVEIEAIASRANMRR